MTERINAARHGTRSKYTGGCRCEPCKDSSVRYQAQYRLKQYEAGYVYNRGRLRRPSKRATGVTRGLAPKIKISKEIGDMRLTNENP